MLAGEDLTRNGAGIRGDLSRHDDGRHGRPHRRGQRGRRHRPRAAAPAIRSHYERAIAAGHGADSWTGLIEIVQAPAGAGAR